MTIEERLENIAQQLEILTGMRHANERRFGEIANTFATEHESIQSLERMARLRKQRLNDLEDEADG